MYKMYCKNRVSCVRNPLCQLKPASRLKKILRFGWLKSTKRSSCVLQSNQKDSEHCCILRKTFFPIKSIPHIRLNFSQTRTAICRKTQTQRPHSLYYPIYSKPTTTMSLCDIVPSGVVTGDNLVKLMDYARDNAFAIPAVNCTRCVRHSTTRSDFTWRTFHSFGDWVTITGLL